MNILEVLWKLGYEVLSFDSGVYKIQFGHEREKRHGYCNDIYEVRVSEVGFNGLGNLYVFFQEVGTDNCLDVYEFKNMDSDELYNRGDN